MSRFMPHRRGIALMISLLTLALVTTSSLAMLRSASRASVQRSQSLSAMQSRLLISDLIPILIEWADEHALAIPFDPSAADRFTSLPSLESGDPSVHLQFIDLSGRLHIKHLDTFARTGLPPDLAGISAPESEVDEPLLALPVLLDELAEQVSEHSAAETTMFPQSLDQRQSTPDPHSLIMAEWLTGRGSGELNLATAPIPLLRGALHGLSSSDGQRILKQRRDGKPIDPGTAASLISQRRQQLRATNQLGRYVPLTTSVHTLGFLIDVEQPGTTSRWWIVLEFVRGSESAAGDSDDPTWQLTLKRRVISE